MSKSNDGGAFELSRSQFGEAVLSLLALAIFVNYVDRGNFATAAPDSCADHVDFDRTQRSNRFYSAKSTVRSEGELTGRAGM